MEGDKIKFKMKNHRIKILLFLGIIAAVLLSPQPAEARRLKIPVISEERVQQLAKSARFFIQDANGRLIWKESTPGESRMHADSIRMFAETFLYREESGDFPDDASIEIMQAIERLFMEGEEARIDDILNYSLICWIIGRKFDSFGKKLPDGYFLVKDNAEFKQTLDCFGYALTEKECIGQARFKEIIERDFTEVAMPDPGDLVVYFHETLGIVHAGIYLGKRKVESKWNDFGPVLVHPLDLRIPEEWQVYRFYKVKQ
ncbi:MAG TPA: hypothetical protein ENN78_00635 [Candidatus Omnitrophica bacterium]|nr:hypothetical protein [Candidatus Omnitrophota bacterium]